MSSFRISEWTVLVNFHVFNAVTWITFTAHKVSPDKPKPTFPESYHCGAFSELPQTCRWCLFCLKSKSNQKYCLGREENKKDIMDIPIQHKDKDCVYCQWLDSVLQLSLLNSHLSCRIAGRQLLASEVISVIKANWPHFFYKKGISVPLQQTDWS